MDDTKKWWESRTVWGGAVAIGAAIAGGFGIVVDGPTQAELVDYIMAGAGIVGGIVAIYGRVIAQKRIGK